MWSLPFKKKSSDIVYEKLDRKKNHWNLSNKSGRKNHWDLSNKSGRKNHWDLSNKSGWKNHWDLSNKNGGKIIEILETKVSEFDILVTKVGKKIIEILVT